ncbi:hypothetical protein WG66_006475 [Moniliophthora roreri]|nr:hypothetical protein WG66_006475 [Moniliophthora roreri]
MKASASRILLPLVLAGALASCAPSDKYKSTCREIEKRISSASQVFYPGSEEYATDIYHTYGSSSQNSTCTVQPGTAQDAATILSIVGDRNTPYAVKSGGHTINPGWSSTPGVLISASRFNTVHYDPETNIAAVGPGQKSEQVYKALEPYNVTVPLGRVSGVGVGGFTLGGGYSWITNQVGLSCDTVVGFEVALPTGKVVKATNTSNADLFFGLKGGGNNFGVVTQINYTAHPQPAVWGGLRVYNGEANVTLLSEAVSQFSDTNADPKAVIGVTYAYNPDQGGLFASIFYYYHGPSPPNGTFDGLLAVPYTSSTILTMSLTQLHQGKVMWRSISITNYTVPVLNNIAEQIKLYGPQAWNHSAIEVIFAVEPLSHSIFSHQPNGPAAYYHQPGKFFAPSDIAITWKDASQDEYFYGILKEINHNVAGFAASAEGGFQPVVPPDVILYSNYAAFDTDTELFFGPNKPVLKEIQNKYDPKGVTRLTKGWKF